MTVPSRYLVLLLWELKNIIFCLFFSFLFGQWVKGSVRGNGSLIFKDLKTGKQRRMRRGAWHVSDFAPVGVISMRDVVQIVDKVARQMFHFARIFSSFF